MIETKININEVIGHVVEAELTLNSYFGDVKRVLKGRIIYSTYQGSLFFMPSGKRSKGYKISEEVIHSVTILKKDSAKHNEYLPLYQQCEQLEIERAERVQREYEEQKKRQQERIDRQRELENEKRENEINEAKSLGGYDELEREVFAYYQSFTSEYLNESFVKDIVVPLLNKLIYKGISNVDSYPKHYFDKKSNPKLCALIEQKLKIKLTNTQKGNVQLLNAYLEQN